MGSVNDVAEVGTPTPEMCPRCTMNEPIFGDSCMICHSLPDQGAMVVRALWQRILTLEKELREARKVL